MSAVTIDELKTAAGMSADDWRLQVMLAADAAGNNDGRIDVTELDAYARAPADGKFSAPTASSGPELTAPRLTDEGLAALRSRIAEKTGEVDELRIVPHPGQPGLALLRTYSRSVYDGDKRIPAIVGYVLSSADVREEHVLRSSRFREDPLIPPSQRASKSDYTGSGDDMGHMRPAKDSPNAEAMYESFYLSNAVPQAPSMNRQTWRELEDAIRDVVGDSGGRAVIFTGSLFLDDDGRPMTGPVPRIHERVARPTHCFKAVLLTLPDGYMTMVGFVVPNSDDLPTHKKQIAELLHASRRSVADIEALSGFTIFSDLPDSIEQPMKASPDACLVLPKGTAVHAASLLWPRDCRPQTWTMPEGGMVVGTSTAATQPAESVAARLWRWAKFW